MDTFAAQFFGAHRVVANDHPLIDTGTLQGHRQAGKKILGAAMFGAGHGLQHFH
jgi:hypothetical protein